MKTPTKVQVLVDPCRRPPRLHQPEAQVEQAQRAQHADDRDPLAALKAGVGADRGEHEDRQRGGDAANDPEERADRKQPVDVAAPQLAAGRQQAG